MTKKWLLVIGITFALGILTGSIVSENQPTSTNEQTNEITLDSPYTNRETLNIKSLSQEDINGLLEGEGTPFGGMAIAAELNGLPGPRHVLDAVEARKMDLTTGQLYQIESLFQTMRSEAIPLGEQIIEMEQIINQEFATGSMTEKRLHETVEQSADLYGKLRFTHLKYHLATLNVLSPEQVETYNQIRGYSAADPCKNVPEGHDPELWKLHNNCE